MPSFSDSIFLFILALLLFGPKRLPVLARELGKWVGEFRRASNEFKMQMEEELRLSEQADRTKQIAAMEAAAPVTPPLPEPDHPHMPSETLVDSSFVATPSLEAGAPESGFAPAETASGENPAVPEPLPIATSGELRIMPPSTGLPAARTASARDTNPPGGLLDSIPEAAPASSVPEAAAHGN